MELLYKAGHIKNPPAAVDFLGEDFELIKFRFKDLKKCCSKELSRLEEHYKLVFGEDFSITLESLNELLYAEPFVQGAAQLFEDLITLIEKQKQNENRSAELDLIRLLENQTKLLYNGYNLTVEDKARVLTMLEALFPHYSNRP